MIYVTRHDSVFAKQRVSAVMIVELRGNGVERLSRNGINLRVFYVKSIGNFGESF
jgi:hypothetical protein